jgi:hypothetical protein
LLQQTQDEVREIHTRFDETNALLWAVIKLQKDWGMNAVSEDEAFA